MVLGPVQTRPCGGRPADVLFLLDASGSIWEGHFDRQLQFVHDVVGVFDLSPTHTRVGVLTFGTLVREEIPLDHHRSLDNLLHNLTSITQLQGGTRTHRALTVASRVFRQKGRKGVLQLLILLTDGRSEKPRMTAARAHRLADQGVIVLAVGIGPSANIQELINIATQPQLVFEVDSFAALHSIKDKLAITACTVEKTEMLPVESSPTQSRNCKGKPADIVFVLDASGSILEQDFRKQLKFVKKMVRIFDLAFNATRIGVMTFGKEPCDQIDLGALASVKDLQKTIQNITQQRGDTETDKALHHLLHHHFGEAHSRPDVVKIGIIITDGLSNNPSATQWQAEEVRRAGVHLFAVGVGRNVDKAELQSIASESHVYHVENFSALESIKELLAFQACQVNGR